MENVKAKKAFSAREAVRSVKEAVHPSSVTWLSWKDTKAGAAHAFAVMAMSAVLAAGADALIGLVFSFLF